MLNTTTSACVIAAIKTVFSRHGVPDELFSDNGPQFRSREFLQFAREWDFVHSTSSPYHPQSNGLAEKAVHIAKNILKKEPDNAEMGLLIYRSTPLDNGLSPAEMLMGRKLRSNLPISESQLDVHNSSQVQTFKTSQRVIQKEYYDRTVKPLPDLSKGDNVRLQDTNRQKWSLPGTVVEKVAPRSYVVKTDSGSRLRRNRRDILFSNPLRVPGINVPVDEPEVPLVQAATAALQPEVPPVHHYVTRSGRVSRPPDRYH